MIFIGLVLAVDTVLLIVCLLALVDQYRTMELIRAKIELDDTPAPVPFSRGPQTMPSRLGLGHDLDLHPHLVLLFLSTSCSTCKKIADSLRGRPPTNLRVVLQAHSDTAGQRWLAEHNLPLSHVAVDSDGAIAEAFGLSVTPAAIVLSRGVALLAQTVPSPRQLSPLLTPDGMPAVDTQENGVTL